MRAPDLILVLKAQAGEAEALDALLRQAQEPLFRYIRGQIGDVPPAEDVLQETLFRIARKVGWLSEPTLFGAWAFRVASREVARHLSRKRPTRPLEEVEDRLAAPEPGPLDDGEREALRGALDRL